MSGEHNQDAAQMTCGFDVWDGASLYFMQGSLAGLVHIRKRESTDDRRCIHVKPLIILTHLTFGRQTGHLTPREVCFSVHVTLFMYHGNGSLTVCEHVPLLLCWFD